MSDGLIVRSSTRHEVVIPARVRVSAEHAKAIRVRSAQASAEGWIEVDVLDFSSGGLGFISPVFLPKGAVVDLEIENETGGGLMLACRTKVQRVVMTDRRPAYLIGVRFTPGDTNAERQVDGILERLDGKEHEGGAS